MKSKACFAALLLSVLAAPVSAQVAEKALTQNGITFISGGIGIDSQERLKAREGEFNLKLVFTLVEGNYLAGVTVSVKDASGRTLIEHDADGPFFLAKLPGGAYNVTAVYEGRSQVRKVAVRDGRLRTEYMRWPANPQGDFVLPRESAGK